MNDQDYIRKAVELADGWSIDILSRYGLDVGKDALAAQLVRQVEKTHYITVYGTQVDICSRPPDDFEWDYIGKKGERTLNTIKAIVDSKVLE